MKKMKVFAFLLTLMLCVGMLTGCGGASMKGEMMENGFAEAPMEPGYAPEYDGVYDSEYGSGASDGSANAGVPNQKLIRTMDLETETNDLDKLMADLDAKIAALNGYVENKSVRNGSSSATRRYRYANLVIRIPVAQLDSFVDHVKDATNIVNYTEKADDITLSYVATQSRITALETEQTRLLELLAKAEDMSDLLQIEKRLTEVRTELEKVTSQLRLYDNWVDYGTVNLSVTEVQEFTVVEEEETVWQRIASGLKENWEDLCETMTNLFVFVVTSLPLLLPVGVAALITFLVVKLVNRKTAKAKKQQEEPPKEA